MNGNVWCVDTSWPWRPEEDRAQYEVRKQLSCLLPWSQTIPVTLQEEVVLRPNQIENNLYWRTRGGGNRRDRRPRAVRLNGSDGLSWMQRILVEGHDWPCPLHGPHMVQTFHGPPESPSWSKHGPDLPWSSTVPFMVQTFHRPPPVPFMVQSPSWSRHGTYLGEVGCDEDEEDVIDEEEAQQNHTDLKV